MLPIGRAASADASCDLVDESLVGFSLYGPPGVFHYGSPAGSYVRTPSPGLPLMSVRQCSNSVSSEMASRFPTRTPSPGSPALSARRCDGLRLGSSDASTAGSEPRPVAPSGGERTLKVFPLRLTTLPARAQPLAWADPSHEQANGCAEFAEMGEWLSPHSSPRMSTWSIGAGPRALELASHAQVRGALPDVARPNAVLPPHYPTPLPCAGAFDGRRQKEEQDEESVVSLDDFEPWHTGGSHYSVSEQNRMPCSEKSELQAFHSQIPLNERGELSSMGSIPHAKGLCFPCIFNFQFMCVRGVGCSYCHLMHPNQKKKRIRPSKRTRQEIRAMQEMYADGSENPQRSLWHQGYDTLAGERRTQCGSY